MTKCYQLAIPDGGYTDFYSIVLCAFLCFLKILRIENWKRKLTLTGY